MFLESNPEQKFQRQIQECAKIAMEAAQLDSEIEGFLEELQVSPEQLSAFIANKDNFTEENWKTLRKQQQELENRLNLRLAQVRDPKKIRSTYDGLHIQPHWLHVR